jgi:hypothetical protein
MAQVPPLAFGARTVPAGVSIGRHTPHGGVGLHYLAAIKRTGKAGRRAGIVAALAATGVDASGVQISFARVLPR